MSDGRKLQQKRQMRHLCSNRLAFSFSTSIWRGLNLSVPYWLWCDNLKKRWHAKAFEIQNDPTRSASLINLFGLDRGVHFGTPWGIRTPGLLVRSLISAITLVHVCSRCIPLNPLCYKAFRHSGSVGDWKIRVWKNLVLKKIVRRVLEERFAIVE